MGRDAALCVDVFWRGSQPLTGTGTRACPRGEQLAAEPGQSCARLRRRAGEDRFLWRNASSTLVDQVTQAVHRMTGSTLAASSEIASGKRVEPVAGAGEVMSSPDKEIVATQTSSTPVITDTPVAMETRSAIRRQQHRIDDARCYLNLRNEPAANCLTPTVAIPHHGAYGIAHPCRRAISPRRSPPGRRTPRSAAPLRRGGGDRARPGIAQTRWYLARFDPQPTTGLIGTGVVRRRSGVAWWLASTVVLQRCTADFGMMVDRKVYLPTA